MRWLVLAIFLCGFTPIHLTHDKTEKIDNEFKNLENTVQDRQFRVFKTTPVLSELQMGEIVIVSSGTVQKLMFRENQQIYSINVSCVTVWK